ncbi:uncharacterized protein LOC111073711 [Drosophila obscura]|uniref:uncharacterized protein LOC111073711 n=1 Tax=Drosophila obscura TaxID=7282 RepID=UPI001BB2AF51|nr:uncharacterized protein LOC111073711 [Drosophila obscura]
MTTETYLDLSYERGKGSKRHHRPKILKLSDVTIPHRSRKKSKVKTKDRSAILVRERIYDDPAYTEDISHLANPIRRGSVPGKHSAEHKSKSDISGQTASASSLLSRHQLTKDLHQYVSAKQSKYKGANSAGAPSGSTAVNVSYNCGSSSSDNATLEPTKSSSMTRRVRSLERSLAKERTDKKATQKRNSKQKRNLSLDNSRNLLPGHSQHAAQPIKQGYDFETRARRTPGRKKYTESSVEAAQTEASELDDAYSVRSSAKDSTATVPVETNAIGKRFLRGEIGIKSFNYYLLKEGLKSSKKLTGKQRSTLHSEEAYSKSEKMHSRSEENIYEEIFFKDTPSTATTSTTALATTSTPPQPLGKEAHNHPQQVQKGVEQVLPRVMSGPNGESDVGVFADCELCMEQCSKDSCEYCLDQAVQGARKNQAQPQKQTPQQEPFINQGYHGENSDPQGTLSRGTDPVGLPAAHILEFQSYNPNNPGVYKIETTPVAITGDYNPILQFQQSSATTSTSTTTTPGDQQQHIQPHQLQQPIYGGYYHPLPHQKPLHTTIVGNPLTRQYAVSGSLLLAQVAGPGSAPPRRPQQQQHYIVSYQNGGPVAGGASLQRLNTKSSSSSDSLPHHKYNTMTRMEANVFSAPSTGDLCYAVGGTAPLHPLMYAASRPIGGSQILIDPYDPPQMYKSDSKASILSEFSLRSSDNSQRYGPHRVSDSKALLRELRESVWI